MSTSNIYNVEKKIMDGVGNIKNSMSNVGKTVSTVPKKIGRAVDTTTRTANIMFTDKDIRNKIIGVINKIGDLTDSTKKSIKEVGSTFEKQIINNASNVKQKVRTVMSAPKNIKKTIKISAKAMNLLLTDKAVRDEITEIVKKTSDLTKKTINEAGETVLKDRSFIDNLKNTSNKIGTQVSSAVYSTVDGMSVGIVSDIQAIYSSFSTTLNTVNLLSSILKLPIDKINEKLKEDSRDFISLIQSLNNIKSNYENLLKKLDTGYDMNLNKKGNSIGVGNNAMKDETNAIKDETNAIKDTGAIKDNNSINNNQAGGYFSRRPSLKRKKGFIRTSTKKRKLWNKTKFSLKTKKTKNK